MAQVDLECCCCGGDAGKFEQWHNRDDGYGVCPRCVTSEIEDGTSAEEIKKCYGVAGVNYQAPPAAQVNCPTCGSLVPTIFEHVDEECETWEDDES